MKIKFSREVRDLVISWLTISIAFALVFSGGILRGGLFNFASFPLMFVISLFSVGTGFILHELSHKYVAIHFGAHAEFRAWQTGLIFALFMALFTGFVFAAPGAVYIYGHGISSKKNGLISLAGPVTNILIAFIALLLNPFSAGYSFVSTILMFTFSINLWLATFNLIPIYPLDGSKVFSWNKLVWAVFFVPLALWTFIF
ncbi:MAG TPA: site-2 protease family protein [archaeon]|nr:site-2 protease family protein [archaeon]